MTKRIHLFICIFFSVAFLPVKAQDTIMVNVAAVPGYYQSLNLDNQTPCNCNEKTERTFQLNKGLVEGDVVSYNLHAYSFSFGSNTLPASKLFKAFENDKTVYKISVKEWDAFMLLTTPEFNKASFENAASGVFADFSSIAATDFLKNKNLKAYSEYVNSLSKETNNPKEENIIPEKITH
ncbi:MAG: hypothetical protein IPM95_09820 [Sphingobacteriales bacterium]|nr:hypothetical protein [Sphingobacteriales bacterium]